jgi:hypothetical protein
MAIVLPVEEIQEHLRDPLGHILPVLSERLELIVPAVELLPKLLALCLRAHDPIAQGGELFLGRFRTRVKLRVLTHQLLESQRVAWPRGKPCADIGADSRGTDSRVGRCGRGWGPSDPAPHEEEDDHDQHQDGSSQTQQRRPEWIQVYQRRRL